MCLKWSFKAVTRVRKKAVGFYFRIAHLIFLCPEQSCVILGSIAQGVVLPENGKKQSGDHLATFNFISALLKRVT